MLRAEVKANLANQGRFFTNLLTIGCPKGLVIDLVHPTDFLVTFGNIQK